MRATHLAMALLLGLVAALPLGSALAAPPANDAFASRTVVDPAGTDVLPFSDTVDASEATTDAGEPVDPCTGEPEPSPSIWYQFSPDDSGRYELATAGSNYDTVLSVWTSETGSFADMTLLECDDDIGRDLSSRIRERLRSDTTYYIRVSTFNSPGTVSRLDISVILTANAGGPYSVAEGESLTLVASANANGETVTSYDWDINRDDDFSDATGQNPTLTWDQLTALGITAGSGPWDARVRVTTANNTQNSAPVTLTVDGAGASAGEMLDELYAMVEETPIGGPASTAAGVRRTLLATVAIAGAFEEYDLPAITCMQLNSFDLQVRSQVSRRRITQADAGPLYAKSAEIRELLGCGGSVQ